jgi:hypothetical protein
MGKTKRPETRSLTAGHRTHNFYTLVHLPVLPPKHIIFNPGPVEVVGNTYENPKPLEPTVVEFKAKSIGGIAVENIEVIPDMPGIVKKTHQEKK